MTARRARRASEPPPDIEGEEPDPHEVARAIVLRQLTMAPRSRHQLEEKLAQRGCDPEVAAAVLNRMEQVGLVDDAAFAGMVTRSQQATRGLSRRGIEHELRKRGVDDELVKDAVAQIDPETERAQARALVEKRAPRMHGLPRDVQTRRLAGMLARKGYSSGIAFPVIQEVLDQAPEHHRD